MALAFFQEYNFPNYKKVSEMHTYQMAYSECWRQWQYLKIYLYRHY